MVSSDRLFGDCSVRRDYTVTRRPAFHMCRTDGRLSADRDITARATGPYVLRIMVYTDLDEMEGFRKDVK